MAQFCANKHYIQPLVTVVTEINNFNCPSVKPSPCMLCSPLGYFAWQINTWKKS